MQAHKCQMCVPRGLWRPKDGEPYKPRVEAPIVQPWLFDAGGHVPNMDRETLKETIKVRLRALFLSYTSPGKDDAFYMVRDADLTRAAESIADFWEYKDPQG